MPATTQQQLVLEMTGNGVLHSHPVPFSFSQFTFLLPALSLFPFPWWIRSRTLGSQGTTEDGECTTEFRTRLNRRQAIDASLQKIWKSHNIPISTKIRLMKAPVWPTATYGCESWTLRKNEETRLDAFEMKGLRKILRLSWTAKN